MYNVLNLTVLAMRNRIFVLVFFFPAISLWSQSVTSDITDQVSLSKEDIEIFKTETKKKIEEFTNYIKILCDKTQSPSNRDMAERQAQELFYTGAIMETTLIKGGKEEKRQRPMSDYLYRLKTLPYTKVVIEFFDIVYANDFTRGPNGKYYATATIFQKFTGFTGDKIAYSDVTKKEISIIIDIVEDEFYYEKRWKLFLGDIKAVETKQG